MTEINCKCEHCGVEFHRPPNKLGADKKFCGRKCFSDYLKTGSVYQFPDRYAKCHPQSKYYSLGMCKPCYRRLKKKYGLTLEQYEELITRHNNACALCFSTDNLVIDHDHTTKAVRGILCFHCNSAIGHFRDNVSVMSRAIAYLGETTV